MVAWLLLKVTNDSAAALLCNLAFLVSHHRPLQIQILTVALRNIASFSLHFECLKFYRFIIDFSAEHMNVFASREGERANALLFSLFILRLPSLYCFCCLLSTSFAFSLTSSIFLFGEIFFYSRILTPAFKSIATETFTMLCIVYFKYLVEYFVYDYGKFLFFHSPFLLHECSIFAAATAAAAVVSCRPGSTIINIYKI